MDVVLARALAVAVAVLLAEMATTMNASLGGVVFFRRGIKYADCSERLRA